MDTLYRVTGPEGKLLHTCTDILGALLLASIRVQEESPINVRGGGITVHIVRDTVFKIAEPLPVGSYFRRQNINVRRQNINVRAPLADPTAKPRQERKRPAKRKKTRAAKKRKN